MLNEIKIDVRRLAGLIQSVQSKANPPPHDILLRYRDLFENGRIGGEEIKAVRLAELMRADPQLSKLHEARVAYGYGVKTVPIHAFAMWLLFLYREYHSANAAAKRLNDLCRDNEVRATIYMFLAGVNPVTEIDLSNGVSLCPVDALPEAVRDRVEKLPNNGVLSAPVTAALYMRTRLSSVLHVGEGASGPVNYSGWSECLEHLHEIRRCLTLIGPCCPTFYGSFTRIDPSEAPVPHGLLISSPVLRYSHHPGPFDPERARALVSRYVSLPVATRAELYVCLERLNQAVREVAAVDKAIDLGISLESMLVHEEGSELRYRFALRGAMLSSDDPEERAKTFEQLTAIYELRSQAVHSGKLKDKVRVHAGAPKQETMQVLQHGIQLAAALAEKVIMRSGSIDWQKLVLGRTPS